MLKKCISNDWKFKTDTAEYTTVDLPHDYAIGQKRTNDEKYKHNGFFPDCNGQYVKYLVFEDNKHYVLDIDGAYMFTEIFMNENYIARHPYGYTPFLVDLTPYVSAGGRSNKLLIKTSPLPMSSRWYSGNGIYRDVFLWEGGDIRIEPWDMFISTENVQNGKAKIRLELCVSSDKEADISLHFTVKALNKEYTKTEVLPLSVKAGKTQAEHIMEIEAPLLWDLESPNLYSLKTEVFENTELLDISENEFGIRTVTADAVNGLLLNGKPVKLRGGCIHHDHGVLGAAAFPAAEERKLRLLKECGFNAVRTAHNPPSLALLELCDRMGIIVMDEAFDVWNKEKLPNDYHLFFEDWYARDISYMVMRDRNHPCVFSYSIGNEILEIDSTSNAGKWSELLCAEVKKYDATRFVTMGINRSFVNKPRAEDIDPDDYKEYIKSNCRYAGIEQVNKATAEFEKPLDIVGRNYYYHAYEREHGFFPDRVIWGSETQAIHFFDSWNVTKKNNYVLGDFTWTAFDNLGEVGAGRALWARDGRMQDEGFLGKYPWRACYQGDMDLCGYRRPQSYFREAVWIGNTEPRIFVTHPEHFGEGFTGSEWHWYDVDESWSFDDRYIGRPVKAETYTDAEKIVWYVNDIQVGESAPEKGIASINTIYQKGKITAAAYKQGKECSRYSLYTVGEATAINITPEKEEISADNRDLCYFDISVVDSCGRTVTAAENEIICTVTGGELMGVFSGNPCNEDQYTSDRCHTFKGRALAIVRTKHAGNIGIKVYSDNLASGFAEAVAKGGKIFE